MKFLNTKVFVNENINSRLHYTYDHERKYFQHLFTARHRSWKHEQKWTYDCHGIQKKKKSVKYKGYSFPFSHDEGTFFFPTLFILKLHFDSLHDLSNVSKLLLKS